MVDQPIHPVLEAIVRALDSSLDLESPKNSRESIIWSLPNLLGALEKAGWVVVPMEATRQQMAAGAEEIDTSGNQRDIYEAMVQAGKVRL